MDDLVLHDVTRARLQGFIAQPGHALLLVGPRGIGKRAVAEALVAALLEITPAQLQPYPYYKSINAESGAISIEVVRQLKQFLGLKSVGAKTIRRAVVMEQAEALTTEAQNAYLKLLEEPPLDTVMILTSDNPRALLPTIMSRVQTLTISVPPEASLEPLLAASGKSKADQTQAYLLSSGLPGLLSTLLSEADHPMFANIAQAKALLSAAAFERLAAVEELAKQKGGAKDFVQALERIALAGLTAAGTKQERTKIAQWHRVRKAAAEAHKALEANANSKLVLTDLLLSI